jgi:hypothetical protein
VNPAVSVNPAKIKSDQSDENEQTQTIDPESIQTQAAGQHNRGFIKHNHAK